ncbi:MAG: hypothetical protein KJP16_01505 [Gammaproteobacteria bacterium]|nr:hypothetical protein [Gammaproteobacteria bacterium]NNC57939.1 hypothetical protein [Woeseiaceae bacterium]NNL49466.1 hypothetical protein [Woeseiaceae bacterium]
MLKASYKALLFVGMVLSAEVLADDTMFRYASRWQLPQVAEPTSYSTDALQPTARFDFQALDIFSRVKNVRELSLLTLAEVGKTRLFIGVNDDGLVGIHIRALPRPGDERFLEISRMPYLEKNDAASGVD